MSPFWCKIFNGDSNRHAFFTRFALGAVNSRAAASESPLQKFRVLPKGLYFSLGLRLEKKTVFRADKSSSRSQSEKILDLEYHS